ncbi:MAG: NAD(+)/NADH kinase [Chloroflexi bacterium]|nr:NAD(+)/NADH kinase [Chloroflexota bacterium]
MKKIAILYNPRIPESQDLGRELEKNLRDQGTEPWLTSARDEEEVARRAPQLEMLVTLGGDGTVLRAARLAAASGIPILPVNLGHLGFLAEVGPEEVQSSLKRIGQGQFWSEERIMLGLSLWRDGKETFSSLALNDVVVGRGSVARAVHLPTSINGQPLTIYIADGIIVATPTGSTAYSLAVGGPILDPRLRALLVTPIAPHLSPTRTLVLPEDTKITVGVETDNGASLTVDGQVEVELQNGDQVQVAKSEHFCRLIRLQPQEDFYRTLQERLKFRAL